MTPPPTPPLFVHRCRIRLHHTDAARVIFFAEQLRLAHDAFEGLLDEHDLSIGKVLQEGEWALPVVHASEDLLAPVRLGDELAIEVRAERVGETSVTVGYRVLRGDDVVGTARLVHVCIGPDGEKRPLPEALRAALGG